MLDLKTQLPLFKRLRRNRKSEAIRNLVCETYLRPSDFVFPYFLLDGQNQMQPVSSMPGISRLSLDLILKDLEELIKLGIKAIDLFPVIPSDKKDSQGSEAINPDNIVNNAIRVIKKEYPEVCVMIDVALDPFTDHGHDGLINSEGIILNDQTVEVLGQMSVYAAEAGADVVAPSDMMDGRVRYIREKLDEIGFPNVNILSYTAKYASAFYGPFRDALNSSPTFGDKKTYQMDPANQREAILEATLDESEGADMLMVKPALPYLDIISKLREITNLPVAAYQVSGEYAMIQAAAQNGWIDGEKVLMESLTSIKRAGADFILTYAAKEVSKVLNRGI